MTTTEPTLGPCPPWCEKASDHGWEDDWRDGPVRFHVWSRALARTHPHGHDELRVEELEQFGAAGPVRRCSIVLDVEAPTEWDVATARRAHDLLAEAIGLVEDGAR